MMDAVAKQVGGGLARDNGEQTQIIERRKQVDRQDIHRSYVLVSVQEEKRML